ncbi:unnamed protein product [Thlaspi arvense]|uniref:F-box domain-containing protein n=1 Tax=Thlaspi arvense TaxID=13288 RepID=A0AAU9SCX1_THLAR|nr:unnamed protein product [Thlaspi arvense]
MEKDQSSGPPSLMMSLPEDIIIDILARVSRYNYPTLSLVSKHFRSLVASPMFSSSITGKTMMTVVGSRIYVFDGINNNVNGTTRALTIDCRYHTVQPLPSMPVPMSYTIADIIDGRIYVIGNRYCDDVRKKVMVSVLISMAVKEYCVSYGGRLALFF